MSTKKPKPLIRGVNPDARDRLCAGMSVESSLQWHFHYLKTFRIGGVSMLRNILIAINEPESKCVIITAYEPDSKL